MPWHQIPPYVPTLFVTKVNNVIVTKNFSAGTNNEVLSYVRFFCHLFNITVLIGDCPVTVFGPPLLTISVFWSTLHNVIERGINVT